MTDPVDICYHWTCSWCHVQVCAEREDDGTLPCPLCGEVEVVSVEPVVLLLEKR